MDKTELINILRAAVNGIEGYSSEAQLKLENERIKTILKDFIRVFVANNYHDYNSGFTAPVKPETIIERFALANSNCTNNYILEELTEEVYNKFIN